MILRFRVLPDVLKQKQKQKQQHQQEEEEEQQQQQKEREQNLTIWHKLLIQSLPI